MILVDVNVLVYAFRRDSANHDEYRRWLHEAINSPTEFALTPETLVGFVRVATNPRIFAVPADQSEAMGFANVIVRAPRSRWLVPNLSVWDEFDEITTVDRHLRANLVPDAWLAALAIAHGCRLATADRGFARFDGLDWFDPVAA